MIQLEKLTKVYEQGEIRVEALKEIDLHVKEGDFMALMGPSGSGVWIRLLKAPIESMEPMSRNLQKMNWRMCGIKRLDLSFNPLTSCQSLTHSKMWNCP